MAILQNMTIAFIGAGNMGRAFIEGCLQSVLSPENVIVVEPDLSKQQDLRERGVSVFAEPTADLKKADIVLLCVKPNQMKATIDAVNPLLASPIMVSIAAGVLIDTIQRWLDRALIVVRAMPNTPATIGKGVTALCSNRTLDEEMKNILSLLFDAVGKTLWLSSEKEMDAVTAISGSGPAYFFYVMSAMMDSAKSLGFSEEAAGDLVKQTALGAACLAIESDVNPQALRERVTSKGGTTEAAISVFESGKLAEIVKEAMHAAATKSRQMSQEYK
jgi:pyrroline-5-carboxylate reductase